MSYYRKDSFEYHFAIRTLYNLKYIDDEVKRMKAEEKEEDEYRLYEVTQLINSFVGLLLVPKDAAFKYINDNAHFPWGSTAERILKKINQDQKENKNTYFVNIGDNKYKKKGTSEEMFNAVELIRHLRNAVAHANFSVYPEKCENGEEISGLRFEDSYDLIGRYGRNNIFFTNTSRETITIHQKFSLVLTIEEVKVLLFAMCKILLDQYPSGDGATNWPEDLQEYIK